MASDRMLADVAEALRVIQETLEKGLSDIDSAPRSTEWRIREALTLAKAAYRTVAAARSKK